MSFFSNKIKKTKKTQIIVENLQLDDLIDKKLLKELQEKFAQKNTEVVATSVRFHIVTSEKNSNEKEPIVKSVNSVLLEHQGHEQTKNKIAVITTSNSAILEKFLK